MLRKSLLVGFSILIGLVVSLQFHYEAQAADESLILYLPLDEGKGEVVEDASKHKNNSKIVGNAKWADGKIGNCLEFSPGSHVEVEEIPDYDVTGAVSVIAWIKTSSVTSWARIIDKSQWQDNGYDLALSQITHAPLFEFFVNNTTSQALATTPVDDGEWHFVAGTFGNKTLRIYVDGVMEKQVNSTGGVDIKPNDWPIWLADVARPQETQQYLGMIDEVAVFNRELSENEIQDVFQNGITVSSPVEFEEKLAVTWGMLKK